jgi:hypothetical protein
VGYSNGSIRISGPQTVAQTNQSVGLYGVGNTTQNSSTTLHARTLSLGGRGDISVGYSNGTIQISGSQSNQSAIKGLGASNTGNTAGNTGLSTGIDWVIAGSNQATISQSTAGGGTNTLWVNVTTAAQTNQSVGLYALGKHDAEQQHRSRCENAWLGVKN